MNKKIIFVCIMALILSFAFSTILFASSTLAANTNSTANTENVVKSEQCKKCIECKKDKLKANLKTLLDTGKISQSDYDKTITLINKNEGFKKSDIPDSVKTALKELRKSKIKAN